jgi:hypothetical protein
MPASPIARITKRSWHRHRPAAAATLDNGSSAGLDPVTPTHDGTALGYPLPAERRFFV